MTLLDELLGTLTTDVSARSMWLGSLAPQSSVSVLKADISFYEHTFVDEIDGDGAIICSDGWRYDARGMFEKSLNRVHVLRPVTKESRQEYAKRQYVRALSQARWSDLSIDQLEAVAKYVGAKIDRAPASPTVPVPKSAA